MSSDEILNILEHEFPNAQAELDHRNVFELLIAVMLSAQCTDKRVNSCYSVCSGNGCIG